ncbi:MAG TPA: GNAT family N-acetyltransferase [Sphingobium sp.]|nr:GNAT family N-acetyltransferase [Sphingobium sp.]
MRIRLATLADLDTLASLFDGYRQFYRQAPDRAGARAFLAARIARGDSVILLAENDTKEEEDGSALGFTQLYPAFTSMGMRPIFILNDLFVAPQARQRGVGSALLRAAADHGRAAGAARLTLSTELDNLAAQRVYEANGWERETRFLSYTLALG